MTKGEKTLHLNFCFKLIESPGSTNVKATNLSVVQA